MNAIKTCARTQSMHGRCVLALRNAANSKQRLRESLAPSSTVHDTGRASTERVKALGGASPAVACHACRQAGSKKHRCAPSL